MVHRVAGHRVAGHGTPRSRAWSTVESRVAALRTPLNQIIGYSEMLQEDAEALGHSEFVSDLKKIELAGRKLLELIQSGAAESLVAPRNAPASTVSESSSRALAPLPEPAAVSALLPTTDDSSQADSPGLRYR